jgi:hypothetical protein
MGILEVIMGHVVAIVNFGSIDFMNAMPNRQDLTDLQDWLTYNFCQYSLMSMMKGVW